MTARSKLDWLCRALISTAFIALFAVGQYMAQNPVGAPAGKFGMGLESTGGSFKDADLHATAS